MHIFGTDQRRRADTHTHKQATQPANIKGNISIAFANRWSIIQKHLSSWRVAGFLKHMASCICMRLYTLVWHLFICCSGYQLLITEAFLLWWLNSNRKHLSSGCFLEHDFCSLLFPMILPLRTGSLLLVKTVRTVIFCVSRHDGYLCVGHLSFPPSQALAQFMLSLSFWLCLLVICPAWVESPKVSCSTLSTPSQPSFLYLQ